MEYRHTIARRIVVAFVLLSVVVAGSFALSIYLVIHFVEYRLISTDLDRELERILDEPEYSARFGPDHHLQVYLQKVDAPATVPPWMQNLEVGFQEVFRGKKSYYAWVRDNSGDRYYLLRDQSEFERHERILLATIFIGFLVCVVIAWLLGRLVVRYAIGPVIHLSRQVRDRRQSLEFAPALAFDYADDEVGQLAMAFNDLLARFRGALRREKLFSADLSHELRTPLMVVASSCELLLADDLLSQAGREKVMRIVAAAEEMRQLVHTLLMLLRSEQGKADTLPRARLTDIVREVEEFWRPIIEQKGLQFQVKLQNACEGNPILPDAYVRIVLNNLLRNAVRHTDQGSITLVVQNGSIVVGDSGAGIPECRHRRVFEPFVQNDPVGDDSTGLGIGLSLVDRICLSQQWTINLESAPGEGTRVFIGFIPN